MNKNQATEMQQLSPKKYSCNSLSSSKRLTAASIFMNRYESLRISSVNVTRSAGNFSFLPKQYENLSVNTTKQGTATPIFWKCDDIYYFLR